MIGVVATGITALQDWWSDGEEAVRNATEPVLAATVEAATGNVIIIPDANANVTADDRLSLKNAVKQWTSNGNGYWADDIRLFIRLSGNRDKPITVTGIRAVDVSYETPVTGTVLSHNPRAGGGREVNLQLDFDSFGRGSQTIDAHRTEPAPDASELGRPQIDKGTYPGAGMPDLVLNDGSGTATGRLEIDAIARTGYAVTFRIEIDTIVDGKKSEPVIVSHDDNRPFRITPTCRDGQPVVYSRAWWDSNNGPATAPMSAKALSGDVGLHQKLDSPPRPRCR
ncbi:hypothetical protein [Nocardia asteroides]